MEIARRSGADAAIRSSSSGSQPYTSTSAPASRDRFFVLAEAAHPKFDRERTAEFLRTLNAREVTDVEH